MEENLKIVPTFNSNGVGVVSATSASKNLTLDLKAPLGGFTGGNPFTVGDEILVENVQIKLIEEGINLPEKYLFLLFDESKQVELTWNGKSDEVTNVVLPFQIIEQIDEPRNETVSYTHLTLPTNREV